MWPFNRRQQTKYKVSTESDFDTRLIITPVEVCNPVVGLSATVKGLWDTGASMSTVSRALIDALGLDPDPNMKMRVHTTSTPRTSNVYWLTFVFGDEQLTLPVMECEYIIDNVSVLVGMDIISKGDFSLTSVNGKTEMKFRIPTQGHIGK